MKEINDVLRNLVEGNNTPSVQYRVFNKDTILHSFYHGEADFAQHRKTDSRTTYHAYSVTKTFTAIAILQLAQQDKLDINQSAKTYLSDFPYPAEVTIKQLLTHTAGIPNPIPLSWIHLDADHVNFDARQFFNGIFATHNKAKAKPNEKFAYSNLGFVLLGQVIENVSGMRYEDYIREYILKQLNNDLSELNFRVADIDRHAKGYHKKNSFSNLILGLFINKSQFMDNGEGIWKPFKLNYVNGAAYGGLVGTPDAFVRYIQALLQPQSQIISQTNKQLLFTENYTNNGKPTGMCISWYTGLLDGIRYYTHAGGGGGYYCEIRIYPEKGVGSVIMFNRTGMTDERILDKVDGLVLRLGG